MTCNAYNPIVFQIIRIIYYVKLYGLYVDYTDYSHCLQITKLLFRLYGLFTLFWLYWLLWNNPYSEYNQKYNQYNHKNNQYNQNNVNNSHNNHDCIQIQSLPVLSCLLDHLWAWHQKPKKQSSQYSRIDTLHVLKCLCTAAFSGAFTDSQNRAVDGCHMWYVNSWALGWSRDMYWRLMTHFRQFFTDYKVTVLTILIIRIILTILIIVE